jgi:hypothetical protein
MTAIRGMMPELGTLLATIDRWRARRVRRIGGVCWCALAVMLWLQGCVIPPDIETPDVSVVRFLKIDKAAVDPSPLEDVLIDPVAEATRLFSVRNAVQMSGITNSLRYSWYYDLDLGTDLAAGFFAFCGSSDRCTLAVCSQKNKAQETHTLLLVVSDGPLIDDTPDPLGFPEGTQYDWVQWHLTVKNPCND